MRLLRSQCCICCRRRFSKISATLVCAPGHARGSAGDSHILIVIPDHPLLHLGLCVPLPVDRSRSRAGVDQRAVPCRNTTLNTCLEAPNIQTAFDALETRWSSRRADAPAASIEGPSASELAASDSAISTPAPEGPTESSGAEPEPAQAAAEQATASSSSAPESIPGEPANIVGTYLLLQRFLTCSLTEGATTQDPDSMNHANALRCIGMLMESAIATI